MFASNTVAANLRASIHICNFSIYFLSVISYYANQAIHLVNTKHCKSTLAA